MISNFPLSRGELTNCLSFSYGLDGEEGKIPKSKTAFRLDEIEDFNLAVDDYSQGGESQWSVDVSDYEDNIKDAPRRVYIGPD